MKNLMIRILISVTFLIAQKIWADDVYNFYFQKAPGPTTVIQGGGQGQAVKSAQDAKAQIKDEKETEENQGPFDPVEEEPKPSKTTTSATSTSVAGLRAKPESEVKKWEFQIGKAFFDREDKVPDTYESVDEEGNSVILDGYYYDYHPVENVQLGMQYNFNRNFAAEGLLQINADDAHQLMAGIVLTPLRFNSFGVDIIEFPIAVGLMNFDQMYMSTPKGEYSSFVNDTGLLTYTSFGIKVNLPGDFSATFKSTHSSDGLVNNNFHSSSFALAYAF